MTHFFSLCIRTNEGFFLYERNNDAFFRGRFVSNNARTISHYAKESSKSMEECVMWNILKCRTIFPIRNGAEKNTQTERKGACVSISSNVK